MSERIKHLRCPSCAAGFRMLVERPDGWIRCLQCDYEFLGRGLTIPERVRLWSITLPRAFACPWIVVNFLLGVSLAGFQNLWAWIFAMIATCLVMFAAHFFNAYWDFRIGLDKVGGSVAKVYTSASQVLPRRLASPRSVLIASLVCAGLGSAILVALGIPWLLFPLALGLGLSFGYSLWFKGRGLGEICLFGAHGIATATCGYIACTGVLTAQALLVSFIPAMLAAFGYTADQWADRGSDFVRRVRSIAWRIGEVNPSLGTFLGWCIGFMYMYHLFLIMIGVLPPLTFLTFLLTPLALSVILAIDREYELGIKLGLAFLVSYPILMAIGTAI